MPNSHTLIRGCLKEAVINRSVAAVLAFFIAFYPVSIGLQFVYGSVWEVPIFASVYAVYFTVAFTIPAALTIPITEAVVGTNLYYGGLGMMVVALGSSYLVLSIGIAGAYRAVRSRIDR